LSISSLSPAQRAADEHADVESDTAVQRVLDNHLVPLVDLHALNARAHPADKHVKAHGTAARANLVDQQLVAATARR